MKVATRFSDFIQLRNWIRFKIRIQKPKNYPLLNIGFFIKDCLLLKKILNKKLSKNLRNLSFIIFQNYYFYTCRFLRFYFGYFIIKQDGTILTTGYLRSIIFRFCYWLFWFSLYSTKHFHCLIILVLWVLFQDQLIFCDTVGWHTIFFLHIIDFTVKHE